MTARVNDWDDREEWRTYAGSTEYWAEVSRAMREMQAQMDWFRWMVSWILAFPAAGLASLFIVMRWAGL